MTQLMTEVGMVRVPAGTWRAGPDHSSAAFEVKHLMIATVQRVRRDARSCRGRPLELARLGDLQGGKHRHRQSRARRSPALTRLLRRRALSRDALRDDAYPACRGGSLQGCREPHHQGLTREAEVDATVEGARRGSVGKRARGHLDPRCHRPHRLRPHLAADARVRRPARRRGSQGPDRRLSGPRLSRPGWGRAPRVSRAGARPRP